jgi:ribosomal protein S18 acetylase RimI-like enzyme
MTMVIRPARIDEYEAVGELVIGAYATLPDRDPVYDAVLRDVANRAATADVLVAEAEGAIIGTVTFVPGPGPQAEVDDPDAAAIRMLGVAPEARGMGVGAALVEECIERARKLGRLRVLLDTRQSMEAAHRLYERAGFRRAPELDRRPAEAPDMVLLGYRLDLQNQ